MRRGLKAVQPCQVASARRQSRRDIPDEEGTERHYGLRRARYACCGCRRDFPDEEGTERALIICAPPRQCVVSRRDIPDEEGTERRHMYALAPDFMSRVEETSPMRRGLKDASGIACCRSAVGVCRRDFPDEEGTERSGRRLAPICRRDRLKRLPR